MSRLGEILGRASILICTECGAAIHVLDAEAHSLNCRATPRFPLPSQVGYHSDSQHQPLAITYPTSNTSASTDSAVVPRQKRKYQRRIKSEPVENEPVLPKTEIASDVDDSLMKSPAQIFTSPTSVKTEPMDGVEFQSPGEKTVKKKVKVMLPSLDSPRGLRTLLPGIMNNLKLFKCIITHLLLNN